MAATIYALHALAVSPEMWQDVREEAPDLRFAAPDLLRVIEEERIEGQLDTLIAALAERAPPGPIVLLGSSIGAHLALELAAVLGARVRGTLLLVPGPPALDGDFLVRANTLMRTLQHAWTDEVARSFVKLLVYPFGRRHASVAERVERMLRHWGPRSAPLLAVAGGFRDAARLLPRIPGPVRALLAADNANPVHGPGLVDAWRKLLGEEAVQRIESASEFLPMERPDAVVAALRTLLG